MPPLTGAPQVLQLKKGSRRHLGALGRVLRYQSVSVGI